MQYLLMVNKKGSINKKTLIKLLNRSHFWNMFVVNLFIAKLRHSDQKQNVIYNENMFG